MTSSRTVKTISIDWIGESEQGIGVILVPSWIGPVILAQYLGSKAFESSYRPSSISAPCRAILASEVLPVSTLSRIAVRLDRAEDGNFGDHQSVGKGVSEMRLSFGNAYRIYYTIRGLTVVILLCGGTKSSQKRDIERAQQMAEELP